MLKKQYYKTKDTCKVTFVANKALEAESVHLVGDFNQWSQEETPMKRQKDGSFTVTLQLERGKEYQFRYLVNGSEWHNDWQADKYVPSPFQGDNSVVVV